MHMNENVEPIQTLGVCLATCMCTCYSLKPLHVDTCMVICHLYYLFFGIHSTRNTGIFSFPYSTRTDRRFGNWPSCVLM